MSKSKVTTPDDVYDYRSHRKCRTYFVKFLINTFHILHDGCVNDVIPPQSDHGHFVMITLLQRESANQTTGEVVNWRTPVFN